MENILSVKNLTKSYPRFKLDNVSFDIPRGSIMGFIGENGAGKTTTIKSILNLIKKDSGTITLFGKENYENDVTINESIGVVFDDNCFQETMTIKDI